MKHGIFNHRLIGLFIFPIPRWILAWRRWLHFLVYFPLWFHPSNMPNANNHITCLITYLNLLCKMKMDSLFYQRCLQSLALSPVKSHTSSSHAGMRLSVWQTETEMRPVHIPAPASRTWRGWTPGPREVICLLATRTQITSPSVSASCSLCTKESTGWKEKTRRDRKKNRNDINRRKLEREWQKER